MIMKTGKLHFLLAFLMCSFFATAQTNLLLQRWYEAPESSKGDTVFFKTTPHVLGPNEDPAYAWSDFTMNTNNTFDIKYWRWCPNGNYAYMGTWSSPLANRIIFDFGPGKCKCDMQIVSVNATELKAIIKETSN